MLGIELGLGIGLGLGFGFGLAFGVGCVRVRIRGLLPDFTLRFLSTTVITFGVRVRVIIRSIFG